MTSKNLQIALIISIGFCLVTSYSTSLKVEEEFMSEIRENFSDFDTIRELKEHFPKNVENSMDLPIQKLTSENKNNEDLEENSDDTDITLENYKNDSKSMGEQKCGNDVLSDGCVDYCYSQAGFNDEFC